MILMAEQANLIKNNKHGKSSEKRGPTGKSKLQDAMDKLNKTYGTGSVLALDLQTTGDYDVITGVLV
jgi:hypothetical protein